MLAASAARLAHKPATLTLKSLVSKDKHKVPKPFARQRAADENKKKNISVSNISNIVRDVRYLISLSPPPLL